VYWEMSGSLEANLGGLRKRRGKPAFAEASAGRPFSFAEAAAGKPSSFAEASAGERVKRIGARDPCPTFFVGDGLAHSGPCLLSAVIPGTRAKRLPDLGTPISRLARGNAAGTPFGRMAFPGSYEKVRNCRGKITNVGAPTFLSEWPNQAKPQKRALVRRTSSPRFCVSRGNKGDTRRVFVCRGNKGDGPPSLKLRRAGPSFRLRVKPSAALRVNT